MKIYKKKRVIVPVITAVTAAIGTAVFFIKRRNDKKARV
jgi:hypothetical protein